jgi:hypothetical protein
LLEPARVVELLGGARARIRQLTGRDEYRLACMGTAPAAFAVSELLCNCVELDDAAPSRDTARNMLVGDRDFAMLQLRALTLGERVLAVVTCPACASRVDVAFDVSEVPVQRRPQDRERYEISYRGRTIGFRLPTGADIESIVNLDLDTAENVLLERCVQNGEGKLTAGACRAVAAAMERLAPQVDLELDLICPECQAENLIPFDCTAFFLLELRTAQSNLMREIHTLASTYHWSEDAILALPRERRHAYLKLVRDGLS